MSTATPGYFFSWGAGSGGSVPSLHIHHRRAAIRIWRFLGAPSLFRFRVPIFLSWFLFSSFFPLSGISGVGFLFILQHIHRTLRKTPRKITHTPHPTCHAKFESSCKCSNDAHSPPRLHYTPETTPVCRRGHIPMLRRDPHKVAALLEFNLTVLTKHTHN